MDYQEKIKELYGSEYFKDRRTNDLKRLKSFDDEKKFIERFVSLDGTVLDVGCSTGEFLTHIDWKGMKYGIEIAEAAAEEARESGIIIVEEYTQPESLDVVIYRGTIQHLDSPFRSIGKAVRTLKKGGYLFILATPNTNSIYYRLFNELSALDPERNFYLPSDLSLLNLAKFFNLTPAGIEYPYLSSPYASPIRDHVMFICKMLCFPFRKARSGIQFPFWGNMMNIAFRK